METIITKTLNMRGAFYTYSEGDGTRPLAEIFVLDKGYLALILEAPEPGFGYRYRTYNTMRAATLAVERHLLRCGWWPDSSVRIEFTA